MFLTLKKMYVHGYLLTGVLCQSFTSSPDEICPGDNVTFTCVVVDTVGIATTTWTVTPDGGEEDCVLRHSVPNEFSTCGAHTVVIEYLIQLRQ